MSWIDLLRMSASNLKRRKLRTFLTVLGVVIGTASIVVMVSLGLGLQKSVYDEMEQSGGLTTINVTGSESVGDGMMYSSNSDNSDEAIKYIDDNCVKKFGELEHVKAAAPIYETSAICLKGKYFPVRKYTGRLENERYQAGRWRNSSENRNWKAGAGLW